MKHNDILNYLIPPPNDHETHVFKIICYNMIRYIYIYIMKVMQIISHNDGREAFRVKFIT